MDKQENKDEVNGWDEAEKSVNIDHERATHEYATSADRDEVI